MASNTAGKGVRWARYLPILARGRTYSRQNASNDLVAALIVTIMLIP